MLAHDQKSDRVTDELFLRECANVSVIRAHPAPTAIQDTCDHVVAGRLRARVEKSHADSSKCSSPTGAPSAYSPEEVRRRRERHELAGIEVLSGTPGQTAHRCDCNPEIVKLSTAFFPDTLLAASLFLWVLLILNPLRSAHLLDSKST